MIVPGKSSIEKFFLSQYSYKDLPHSMHLQSFSFSVNFIKLIECHSIFITFCDFPASVNFILSDFQSQSLSQAYSIKYIEVAPYPDAMNPFLISSNEEHKAFR